MTRRQSFDSFDDFKASLIGLWAIIKEFGKIVTDVFIGVEKVIHGVFNFDLNEITEGASQAYHAIDNIGSRLATAGIDAYKNALAEMQAEHQKMNAPHAIAVPGRPGVTGLPGTPGRSELARASGQKNTTINGGLVHSITHQVKNMTESTKNIKEHFVAALLSAVNDSQIVAGQ